MEYTNIHKLLEKLKGTLAEDLRSQDDQHGKYLVFGQNSISRAQLAHEIESGSDLGIDMISDAVILAIDLIARNKEKPKMIVDAATDFSNEEFLKLWEFCRKPNGRVVFPEGLTEKSSNEDTESK